MVALSQDYQQATDWGTSAYVRDVLKRQTLCRTLYLDAKGALEAVSRTYTAPDCQPAEELVLHDFSDLADALAFYEQLNFRPVSKSKKRIVLQASAVTTQARTFDGREPDFTPRILPQKPIPKRANAPIERGCKIEGCTEPRETQTGRRLCATHRRDTDKANKRARAAAKKAEQGAGQS